MVNISGLYSYVQKFPERSRLCTHCGYKSDRSYSRYKDNI